MSQLDLPIWAQKNLWRVFVFNGFVCLLLVCWVIKQEGGKFTIHFALKYLFPYQSDKIKELIVNINNNKHSFWNLSRTIFGLIYIYKKSNWNLLSPILLHSLINLLFIGMTLVNPSCSLI